MIQKNQKLRRQKRIRAHLKGTSAMPRLSVYRSNSSLSAQLIDDMTAKTIFGITEKSLEKRTGTKTERAKALGILLGEKAKEKNVTTVVFDRGSYRYHGRVKAFAEGAREGGLQF